MINKRSVKFTYEKTSVDLKPMAIFLSEKFEKELFNHAEQKNNF